MIMQSSHGGCQVPRTKTIPRLNVGDKVRVSTGVSDPDYDDLTIGGWAGTIADSSTNRLGLIDK